MDHRRGAFDNPISRAVDPAAVLRFGSEIASLLLLPRWRVSGRAADRERFSSRRFAPGDSQEQNTPRVDEKVDLSRPSLNLMCESGETSSAMAQTRFEIAVRNSMPENLLLCLLWLEEAWIGWDLDQFCAAARAATSVRINPGGRPCFEWISNQPSRRLTTLTFTAGSISPIGWEDSLGAA